MRYYCVYCPQMKAIIPQPTRQPQQSAWQIALQNMITCPRVLLNLLELPEAAIPWQWDLDFPLRVTHSFVKRMKKGDPFDPLLRQVITTKLESQKTSFCTIDPLKETISQCNPLPGLLHKYAGRVLLTFTAGCAIHCRYCFRRHFPYSENNPGRKGWSRLFDYLSQHPEVIEVIFSGGDPLLAQDNVLFDFLKALHHIPHIQFIRFHTRLPVVIPERITPDFVGALSDLRYTTSMVYHINHPAELTPEIATGVRLLQKAGITVLNQSVLLKDINDEAACLKNLSLALFKAGILPYYVHLLDPVAGASHFAVPLAKAKSLQKLLRESLPGYLLPRFVKEIPYEKNKVPLDCL